MTETMHSQLRHLLHDLRSAFAVVSANLEGLDPNDRRIQRAQAGLTRGEDTLKALADLSRAQPPAAWKAIDSP